MTGIAKAQVGAGKRNRKLRGGINTWAGHAPGIVANGGLMGGDKASIYLSKYGLDVEFTLLEDPQTKLAWFGGVSLFFITLIFPVQFDRQWITCWASRSASE